MFNVAFNKIKRKYNCFVFYVVGNVRIIFDYTFSRLLKVTKYGWIKILRIGEI